MYEHNIVSLAERRGNGRPQLPTWSAFVVVPNPMFWLCIWGGTVFAVMLAALEPWRAR